MIEEEQIRLKRLEARLYGVICEEVQSWLNDLLRDTFNPENFLRFVAGMGIDLSQIDFTELLDLIDQGLADGKLVDVEVQDPQEGLMTVEVYIE